MTLIQRFAGDRRGVTLIEYALIAALVAIASFAILQTMGTQLCGLYSRISSRISTA
jgi:Flp pilus assembly pilin Flp